MLTVEGLSFREGVRVDCGKHINKDGGEREKRASVKVLVKERLSPQRADKEKRKTED